LATDFPLGIYSIEDIESGLPTNELNEGSLVILMTDDVNDQFNITLNMISEKGHAAILLTENATMIDGIPSISIQERHFDEAALKSIA